MSCFLRLSRGLVLLTGFLTRGFISIGRWMCVFFHALFHGYVVLFHAFYTNPRILFMFLEILFMFLELLVILSLKKNYGKEILW